MLEIAVVLDTKRLPEAAPPARWSLIEDGIGFLAEPIRSNLKLRRSAGLTDAAPGVLTVPAGVTKVKRVSMMMKCSWGHPGAEGSECWDTQTVTDAFHKLSPRPAEGVTSITLYV